MRVHDCNWKMLEEYLGHDDRIVLPIGSTEQHGYLSVGTDAILAERVAVEAAEPLGVPVLPALPFGITPYFAAFPGSPSLRTTTYIAVIRDLLDSLFGQGFRRIAVINGHGGNSPASGVLREWLAEPRKARVQLLFHDWWNAPRVWAVVQRYEKESSHGSWMENFPWTRLPGVNMPGMQRPMVDMARVRALDPVALRQYLGDGNFGGVYQRSDDEMLALWQIAVDETRALLTGSWGEAS